MLHRLGWALTGAMALIAVLALARALEAGPLDPPGPVGSTMRTLGDLPTSWDRRLTAASADPCHSERFECIYPDATYADGAAVLDRETNLVWQRAPAAVAAQDSSLAAFYCTASPIAGVWGWRLPTIDELTSLFWSDDPGPFALGTGAMEFWSSTEEGAETVPSLTADFANGTVNYRGVGTPFLERYWCVRGGAGGGRR